MKSLFIAFILFLLLGANKSYGKKYNVLLIAIDDLNDWVGCLETNPQALTPVSYTHLTLPTISSV